MDQTSETEKSYQKAKYNEIIEILISAGYFRARINTLSEFDKVVGGLCWCITSSGEIVDVDILFQENSTIGQKIALSESIVTALRKMGCPAPLQPHQIQGGVGGADYPAIHTAIVWLVKKYFERRVEREQLLRSYSIFQFSKNYTLPSEASIIGVSPSLQKIISRNKSIRQFKRKPSKKENEEMRVRSCLLEFGETFAKLGGSVADEGASAGGNDHSSKGAASGGPGGKGSNAPVTPASTAALAASIVAAKGATPKKSEDAGTVRVSVVDSIDMALADLAKLDINEMSGFEKQLAKAAKEAKKDELLFAEQATKQETEIMKQMLEIDESNAKVLSGSQVGNIVGLGADEISFASAAYQAEIEESKKQLDENVASGRLGAAAAFTRQMQNLIKQKEELVTQDQTYNIRVQALKEKLALLDEEKTNALEYIEKLKAQYKKLLDLELNTTQKKDLTAIKELIALNETLKQKEIDFKTSCKTQRQEYLDKIKAMEQGEGEDTPEMRQQREIEDMHNKVTIKYNKLRQMLAEANREVATSIRVIDDTPTRTELIQYERRFVELYQQVEWKLEETRKYYDSYNSLDSSLSFVQKEVKLLNSISDNFADAMKTSSAKLEFTKQFDNIVRGVEESAKRQEAQLAQKQQMVEDQKLIYQNLVDEQRRYYKAVKDFQDSCNKNEWLLMKLEQIKKQ